MAQRDEFLELTISFDEFGRSTTDAQQTMQALMRLMDLGILDRDEARRQLIRENPWLTEAKKISIESPKKSAEKTETPPGKRKIIL